MTAILYASATDDRPLLIVERILASFQFTDPNPSPVRRDPSQDTYIYVY
jgi:hypothetical protein